MRIPQTALACCSALSLTALAADPSDSDKSGYWLLDRTPTRLLRPLSSDLADKVEDPFTVDAGHAQLEVDLVNYFQYEKDFFAPGAKQTIELQQLVWNPLVKLGLCNRVDLEVQTFYSYEHVKNTLTLGGTDYSASDSRDGFDTVEPRVKVNLWGNDGGDTALAVVPGLIIPTEGGSDVMGNLALPFAWRLPEEFLLKIHSEIFWFQDGFDDLHNGFNNNASITKALLPNLDAFANIRTTVTTEDDSEWFGYAGLGAAYRFTPDFQLHAAIGFGLTESSYDYNPYFGLTWRY